MAVLGSSLASAGWGQGPLRYNLAAYAWAKPMLEDFSFYPRFNASYYAQRANNWSVAYDEATLVGIAAETKPLVEDQPFANWIAGQYVLDSSPPVGDFAYIKSMGADHNYVSLFR